MNVFESSFYKASKVFFSLCPGLYTAKTKLYTLIYLLAQLQHCKKLFVVSLNSVGLLYTMSMSISITG